MKKLLSILKSRNFNIYSSVFIVIVILFIGSFNSASAVSFMAECSTSVNACNQGTFSDENDTDVYYKWLCTSENRTSSVFCYSKKPVAPVVIPTVSGSLPMTCGGDYYYLKMPAGVQGDAWNNLYKKVGGVGTEYNLSAGEQGYHHWTTATCCAGNLYVNFGEVQKKIFSGGTNMLNLGPSDSGSFQPLCIGNNYYYYGELIKNGVSNYENLLLRKSMGSSPSWYDMGTEGRFLSPTTGACNMRGDNMVSWTTKGNQVCRSAQNSPEYKCFTSSNPVKGECKPGDKCNFVDDCYYCDTGTSPTADGSCLPPTSDLTVTISNIGGGSGTIISNPSGINCGATCAHTYTTGASVTLTAAASSTSSFTGWSGDCGPGGQVTMNGAKTCTASFTLNAPVITNADLTVTKTGTGTGTVTGSGINCGSTCTSSLLISSIVTLTATPAASSSFTGWTGDCNANGQVIMGSAKTCTANFTLDAVATSTNQTTTSLLTVSKIGTGSGTVTGSGINCGSTCTYPYLTGIEAALNAIPATGSIFIGWSGDCNVIGEVAMIAPRTCVANFALNTATIATTTLTLTKTGTGSGVITSSPNGINCGSTCANSYQVGAVVTLTATPATGSIFTGWSGNCDTNGQVTMSAAKTCTANFTPDVGVTAGSLTVTKGGTGSGTITGSGIYCGSTCNFSYLSTTVVTLTATPASGSIFSNWSGDCNANGQVTITNSKTCQANFTSVSYMLTLNKIGLGILSGAGLYNPGTVAIATANPAANYSFTGWTGDCNSNGQVTMNAPKTCVANFIYNSSIQGNQMAICQLVELLISINAIDSTKVYLARQILGCLAPTI